MTTRRAVAVLALCLGLATPALGAEAPAHGPVGGLGSVLPVWTVLPFVLLLLSIAILPLAVSHWWEHNRNKAIVSALLGVPFAAYLLSTHGAAGWHELRHSLLDYVSFMALLGSLFVVAGGIHVRGSLSGTPLANSALLGIGAVLANLFGTTGASVVLIRPLLRANEERRRRAHIIVFFIFVVSNCGGLLTPLGDPPLFLGFLKGVPFTWTLGLWKEWLLVNGLLILVFNFYDQHMLAKEESETPGALLDEVIAHEPLRIEGGHNVLFLLGVVLVIVAKGQGWGAASGDWPFGVQEALMAVLAVAAYLATKGSLRAANRFTFGPIVEVAVLFAGIFVTMVAPLLILNARGGELGLVQPWQYYWATGSLSSFLDNAPTYLTFAATAAGQLGISVSGSRYLAEFLALGGQAAAPLAAISCGAVMMGANTYIGNGPNFMVKAIAEENGVKMPSFFGYMAYSLAILIPTFLVVTFIFFRP
jgi:Na+/H+ antiporter NhaD/arsenite permease-like protein